MRRPSRALLSALALLIVSYGGSVAAQDAPLTTVTATYQATVQDGSDWTTAQAASLGLTARWGSTLRLDGQLRAPFDGSALTADALLQQLSITWNLDSSSVITFGKQRLKWGTARVFSAVDGLEARYDALHPNAVLDGVTGVNAEILPNDWLSLSVLVLPAPTLKNTRQAFRADVLWGEADLSAGVVHGWEGSRQRGSVYADFAWFGERLGLYGEASLKSWRDRAWSYQKGATTLGLAASDAWTPKATLGTQIEFPVWLNGTLRWLSEYHYNGEGFDVGEARDFEKAWSQRTTADHFSVAPGLGVTTFSRHYAYTGLQGLPITEKLSLAGSGLAGLDTGFFLGRVTADYAVDQGLFVALEYSWLGTLPVADGANEDLLVERTNQVVLTVSTSY